jgi:hypothetical protein
MSASVNMAKYSLVYDGFSVSEAQSAPETATVLSQALGISEEAGSKLLLAGSGVLQESEDQLELNSLKALCTSLGLNCSVVFTTQEDSGLSFDSGAIETETKTEEVFLEEQAPQLESSNDTFGVSLEDSPESEISLSDSGGILVDDLVDQLEHNSQLKTEASLSLSEIGAKLKQQQTSFSQGATNSQAISEIETLQRALQAESQNTPQTSNEVAADPMASSAINQFDWGQTDALTFVKKSRRTERLIDLATAVMMAFLVSLLGYFMNNSSQFEERIQEQQKYVESLLKNIEAEQKIIADEQEAASKPVAIPSSKFLVSIERGANWEVSTEVYADEADIKSFDIVLETPPPPNLTDEEIVNKIEQKPWLHRVLISELTIKSKENRKFIATGKARAFIEHRGRKLQSLGEVVITGEMSENHTSLTGRMMVNRGFEQIPQGDHVLVEPVDTSDYKYFAGIPINAKYDPTK